MAFNKNEDEHTFQLYIKLGGSAMSTHYDVGRKLIQLGERLILSSRNDGYIMDDNGNCVGDWVIARPEEDNDE